MHGEDIVIIQLQVRLRSFVVRKHDGSGDGRMRQAQTVPDLVSGHCEEVHTGVVVVFRADDPRFILIEVHVPSARSHFVRIVSVSQSQTRTIEGIPLTINRLLVHVIIYFPSTIWH